MSIHRRLRILFLPVGSNKNEIVAELISNYIIHILKFKFITFNNIKIVEYKNDMETINDDLDDLLILNLKKKYDIDFCIQNKLIQTNTNTLKLESVLWDCRLSLDSSQVATSNPIDNLSLQDFSSNNADINFINNHISLLASKICLVAEIAIDKSINDFFVHPLCKDSIYPIYLKEKTISAKLELLKKLLTLDKKNPLYLYEQASCLRTLKNYNEAISNIEVSINCTNLSILKSLLYYKLGNIYKSIENNNMAKDSWSKSLNYVDNYVDPILSLAKIYEDEEHLNESEKYYVMFQQIQPEDSRSYLNLARIHCKKESWQRAIEEYKKHLIYYPYDAWSHSNMANCYLCLDKINLAKKHLEEAIKLDSSGEAGMFSKYVLESLTMKVEVPWWKFWAKI